MSLINKMLQDLDARGGSNEGSLRQEELKAVPPDERDRRPLLLGGAVAGVAVIAAGAWFGWQAWQSHKGPTGPLPKVVDNSAPIKPRFQEPPKPATAAAAQGAPAAAGAAPAPATGAAADGTVAAAPGAARSREQDAIAGSAELAQARGAKESERAGETPGAAPAATAGELTAAGRKRAARVAAAAAADADGGAAEASASPASATASASPRARKTARASAGSDATSSAPANGVVVRELTPQQQSENSYRRALAALQEGRVSAAMADLDKALEVDPRNDAARQTYVSLLLENRRNDEAIRQLRLALGIDPRQPGLAMVLARLQLEKGGPALQTLMKTLPYAGSNPDYHAFLAGVLEREQRHAEAAEQYRQALELSPQNGVWWMGLGIALQADQHLPEAREAFNRARGSAGLTPELRAFVDRKLEQLPR